MKFTILTAVGFFSFGLFLSLVTLRNKKPEKSEDDSRTAKNVEMSAGKTTKTTTAVYHAYTKRLR